MSSWSVALYSSDFAMDVRSTIRAVSRLPFDPERLIDIICGAESSAASNPENEDYTTFWLVVADQCARRGIASERARETGLTIIDSGKDLEMQRKLGQSVRGIEKRRQVLAELRDRLISAASAPLPKRKTMREPEPFVMDVGDVMRYPTCAGRCWNPYTTRPDQLRIYGPGGGQPWTQDGWGAMVIVERGRAFGFFSWYRPIIAVTSMTSPPELEELRRADWHLESPGACTPTHFRRMQLKTIGRFPVDVATVHRVFPGLKPGDSQAISDITIANRMRVGTGGRDVVARQRGPYSRIIQIDAVAST